MMEILLFFAGLSIGAITAISLGFRERRKMREQNQFLTVLLSAEKDRTTQTTKVVKARRYVPVIRGKK